MLRETLATTWAAKVSSLLIAVVVAATCLASLMTVGRSAAAAAEVASRMEQAGARKLSVIDTRESGFVNERTVRVIAGLSFVETAVALGTPFDAVNGQMGAGGIKVPVWPVMGEVDHVGRVARGRAPHPGEALVSTSMLASLNLAEPVGYLTSSDGLRKFPIVGSFTPVAPFEDTGGGVILAAPRETTGRELRVVVDNVASAKTSLPVLLGVLAPPDPQGVQIDSPASLAQTAQDLNAQMAGFGRTLLLLIVGAGGFFVAAVVLADVLIRRRDLGRRRTLGITRSDLVLLVAARALVAAVAGAVLGCVSGGIINQVSGSPIPLDFVTAIGVLACLVATVVALLPAWYASRLDPVRVMRAP